MSWRGQGGRRARGRRGEQDPELDNTAWLAELEREAAQADDDEDDWADTLRSRRAGGGGSPGPQPAGSPAFEPAPPAGDPGWSGQDPRDAAADPDWAWRRPDPDPYGEPPPGQGAFGTPLGPAREEFGSAGQRPGPDTDWSDPGTGGWRSAGADAPTGAWSPADPLVPGPGDPLGPGTGYRNGREPGYPAASEPAYPDAPLAGREPNYPTGYPEAEPPVGREPDYPALFGELYRRSATQQDPIWEAPPPVEPLPEAGPAEPVTGTWPFEETTQSWEPSDRSFIWPSDELPSPSAPDAWERPAPAPWDEPAPQPPARPEPADPGLDHTAARPGTGNGLPPQPTGPLRPPPDDWAAAIPTDVPAARRAADPATGGWRPDDAVDAEPGVPLGPGTSRLRGGPGPGAGRSRSRQAGGAPAGATEAWAGPGALAGAAGTGYQAGARLDDEPIDVRRKRSPGRPADDHRARAWPRIVAVVSWIVLVMVVCWFYVFPWLERVLPENF